MKNIAARLSLLVATSVALLSCSDGGGKSEKRKKNDGDANPECLALNANTVTWDGQIQQLVQTNCVSCHSTYTNYDTVKSNGTEILTRIALGSMPKKKALSATDKATFATWGANGMPKSTTTPVGSTVTWDNQVQSIIQTNCVSCHSAYVNYETVKTKGTDLLTRVANGSMPKGKVLNATDKATIAAWGAAGMPKSTSTPITGTMTWDNQIQSIIQTNCVSCHAPYTSYDVVKSKGTDLLTRVANGTMPKGKILSATDKAAIAAWGAAGMPKSTTVTPTTPTTPSDCFQSPTSTTSGATTTTDGTETTTPTTTSTTGTTSDETTTLYPTYAQGVSQIISTSCLSCHKAKKKSPALDTLEAVKTNYTKVLASVKSGTMPKGAAALAPDLITVLELWGSPENPNGAFAP